MYQPKKGPGLIKKVQDKISTFKAKYFVVKKKKEPICGKKTNPKFIYETRIVPYLKKELSLIGFRIFDPKYKCSFFFAFIIIDASTYLIVNMIDIWLIWGSDLETFCFCLVTYMLAYTGLMLAYTLLENRLLLCDLLKIIYEFGDNLDRKTESEEIEKYVNQSRICQKLFWYTTSFCATGMFVCTFYPIGIYFVTGKAVLPYGFFIPGVSTTDNPGYFINYLYQGFQCYCTVLGTMQTTFHTFLLFISNAFFQIDNLIIKLRKLNSAIEAKPNKDGHETELQDIVKLHHRFQSYLAMVDGIYNMMFFVNIAAYTIMNIITLFVLVNQIWFIGYYQISVLFGLIFLPCAIGTVLEMKNDELINEVYNVSWYLLTPKERKTFRFFLLGVQKTPMPSCGGFLPLNVNTFRMTYAKIYSILMFLKDSQKEK